MQLAYFICGSRQVCVFGFRQQQSYYTANSRNYGEEDLRQISVQRRLK